MTEYENSYEAFARVYDIFMSDIDYDSWCGYIHGLLQEYGVLHCGEDVLTSLPAGLVVFTRRGAYGCESLVRERRTVQELLPEAVCDAARLDDIMRFYSGRDAQ